ncbi:unnamed protein product [Ascophyllum nodosum]
MSNDLFQTLCNGCEEPCAGCYFERQSKTPFCAKTMDNTHSSGGVISVKHVTIDSGYWRANKFGLEVLPCYNAEACLGGLTGEPGFCLKGYEGPCKYESTHIVLIRSSYRRFTLCETRLEA